MKLTAANLLIITLVSIVLGLSGLLYIAYHPAFGGSGIASTISTSPFLDTVRIGNEINFTSGADLRSSSGNKPIIGTFTYPSTLAWNSSWTQTGAALSSPTVTGTLAAQNITSGTGSLKSPASVIVFTSGSTTYWKNGTTGEIGYSGSSSALAIQDALDSMTDGGTINIANNVSTISSTINVTRHHIDFTFEAKGGDSSDGSEFIDCTASPCFNITGAYVYFIRGDFKTSVAGTNIFKVSGAARVRFENQNFFASSGISRNILPYHFQITADYVDVKVSHVYASAKNFMKIEKTSAATVTRQHVEISDITWRTDANGGTGFNLTADTRVLEHIDISGVYGFYSTGTFINMTAVNGGAIQFVNIDKVRSEMNNGIYMSASGTGAWISAVSITNSNIDAVGASSSAIKAVGLVHSIMGDNIGIQMGAGAGATGLDIEPSSKTNEQGHYFIFTGLRIYDVVAGQYSIKTNENITDSKIIGTYLYLQYANINSASNVTISSPYSERNYLSDTFAVDSTGLKTVTVTHGLSLTPYLQDIQVTVVENTNVDDWNYTLLKVDSVSSTTITIKIFVSGASATGGATARFAVRVNPSN